MKKNSTASKNQKRPGEAAQQKLQQILAAHQRQEPRAAQLTIGLDIGDRRSCYCVLDPEAEVLEREEVVTDEQPLRQVFGQFPPSVVVLEVSTHSPWISRLLEELGHEVLVANPRKVQLISHASNKHDRRDAELLARLGRADRKLLAPVRHRGIEAQTDLLQVRVRAQLMELRTQAANAARGLVKSFGERLPVCDVDQLSREQAQPLPAALREPLEQLLRMVEELTAEIALADEQLRKISAARYAEETARLQQVQGVGPITALTFVLTLEDPHRFAHSRDAGCYVGLRPIVYQSGDSDPEMRISKEGDSYLRKLLVQCSQYILSRRGEDTDLKRWGLKLAAKGKKKAKRRAVVAVARKLAVLLHRLWISGERYEPLRQANKLAAGRRAA